MRIYPSTIERFYAAIRTDLSTGCWNWTKWTDRGGYGGFRHQGKLVLTHRFAYEYFREPIPSGLQIDHLCRNRACCNPWHLEVITAEDHCQRSPISPTAVNARKVYCKRGHEFTRDNTYHGTNGRECLICKQMLRKRRARKHALWAGQEVN
jgi:hypothetical protein